MPKDVSRGVLHVRGRILGSTVSAHAYAETGPRRSWTTVVALRGGHVFAWT